MTILDMVAPATDTKNATITPDPQPDVQLSVGEKDAVVQVVAANEKPAEVPGAAKGERRAWSQPQGEARPARD